MDKPETEILRRVHFDKHCLEIGEWPDSPDCIELRTDKANAEYWGPINLVMQPDMALQVGKALIAAAREKGAKEEEPALFGMAGTPGY